MGERFGLTFCHYLIRLLATSSASNPDQISALSATSFKVRLRIFILRLLLVIAHPLDAALKNAHM